MTLNITLYGRLALDKVLTGQPSPAQTAQVDPIKPATKTTITTIEQTQQSSETNPAKLTATQAQRLFNSLLFPEAVTLYEELTLVDEQIAMTVKRNWLEQLKTWLKNNDLDPVEGFNEAVLARFPYDLAFLEIKAEALVASERKEDAIELYYSLISYTFETRQEEYFQARIRHLAGELLNQFKQGQLWQAIVELTQQLLQQESDYPPYILAQAEALIKIEDFDNAESLLTALLDNKFYQEQTEQLLKSIRDRQLQQTAIKLQPMGEHYLVYGQLNQSRNIRLMIDTGASISVLTRNRFDEIVGDTYPEYIGETLLSTAGGQVNAPIYKFERFQIDEFYVNDISFVVLDLDDMRHYHGLLGMNFLKQFHFQIDQHNNLLILSP